MERQTPLQLIFIWMLLGGTRYWHQASAATDEADLSALQAVSRGWTQNNLNWSGTDPCGTKWQGVQCDSNQNVNVTILNLSNVGIGGRLLASIGSLANLVTLDLSFNPQLGGPIPRQLGNLVNLQYLTLQSCSFTGSIPVELGRLKNLKFLGLNINQLSGNIPAELGALSQCTWLDLSQNNLSGELPVSTGAAGTGLDNLTSALHFHLNNNSFTGSVPKEITTLPNLIHLLVDNNNMDGAIPDEIGNFKSLEILRLDNNKFSGPFPSNISKVTTLEEIHIRNNSFTSLPDLSSLSDLLLLSVGMNSYSPQPFPSLIASLTKLQTIEFDRGNLIGELPSSLLALPSLESMSFVGNDLNGTVRLGNVSSSLALISLNNNDIAAIASPPSNALFQISLGENPVCKNSRNLPSYVNCSSSRSLADTWTPVQGSCTNSCSDKKTLNPLTCSCAFPLLIRFQFNAPTFSTMTMERDNAIRRLLARGVLLNENQVWISTGSFTDNLRFIADTGFFPAPGLDRLSDEEASFILSQFVFHRANLTGFDPYSAIILTAEASARSSTKSKLAAGAIAGICIALVLVVAAIIYAVRQKFRADKAAQAKNPFASWGGGTDNGDAPVVKGVRNFAFAELKKATNNFSNEIGVGGYGKVYKGYLLTGEVVAIKRAQAGSMQGALEFKTEIELLSRLHHRNLVELVGFCYEQGEQMLVYEYMPNGSIYDHLLGHYKPSKVLTWSKRLEIAVGAARGLSYLHDLANPPIIHRDIKSSNILLDDMFVAKVADLGLSKVSLADQGKTHVSTQVKGTLGYMDPEYYMTQQLTEKSDVYSFGVVLLELITARPPIEDGKYIVREMRNALSRGSMAALLDRSLDGYATGDIEEYVSLAMTCVEESAAKRPTMNDVVKELEVLLSHVLSEGSRSGFHAGTGRLYDNPAALRGSFEYSGGITLSNAVEAK